MSLFFPSFEDVVQPSVNSVFSQRLHAEARRAIGRFFLYSDINKLVCCSEQSILPAHVYAAAVCGAGFKGPSYNEMRTTIRVEEKEDLEKEKELSTIIKSWKDTGCTIICDGWTNKRGRPFIHFCFTCPRGTMFVKAVDATLEVKDAILLTGLLSSFVMEVGEPSESASISIREGGSGLFRSDTTH